MSCPCLTSSLTDPERYQNWLDHGNPDGKSGNLLKTFIVAFSLGIALPAWLVDKKNSVIVLGIYGLLIGIGLPLWVVRFSDCLILVSLVEPVEKLYKG
jgi:translocation protein SEC63